jgi:hypothetical protein
MITDTGQIYLPQRFQPRSTATIVGHVLWYVVRMALAVTVYMLYRLTDPVRREHIGYQYPIHIPVSYENHGEPVCHAA